VISSALANAGADVFRFENPRNFGKRRRKVGLWQNQTENYRGKPEKIMGFCGKTCCAAAGEMLQ
jgi:hypothetical protein